MKSLSLNQLKLYNELTLEKQDMHLTSTILYIGVGFSIFIGFTGQQALVSYLFAFRLLEKFISILTFILRASISDCYSKVSPLITFHKHVKDHCLHGRSSFLSIATEEVETFSMTCQPLFCP